MKCRAHTVQKYTWGVWSGLLPGPVNTYICVMSVLRLYNVTPRKRAKITGVLPQEII